MMRYSDLVLVLENQARIMTMLREAVPSDHATLPIDAEVEKAIEDTRNRAKKIREWGEFYDEGRL